MVKRYMGELEKKTGMRENGSLLEDGISVILCTYNGATKLPQTLRHLAAQRFADHIPWEIIFVDNNSTDRSTEVAKAIWADLHIESVPLICLRESKPAKYYALQTAMAHASYQFFVICDDDNWLEPEYLNRIYELLNRHPNIGAVGGQGIPVTDADRELPEWFFEYSEGYAVGKQGKQTGDVTKRGYLWGAGLGSRTAVYKSFYEKYPSFLLLHDDPSIMTTEDTEYCLRLILRGYELYYDEALKFRHFIPEDKLTKDYMHALYKKNHEGFVVTGNYYLAIKLFDNRGRIEPVNKLRLMLLTPLRLLLARTHKKRIREQTIISYLFPSARRKNLVTSHVQEFVRDKEIAAYTRSSGRPSRTILL